MVKRNEARIKSNDRVFFAGQTGSGKTTLAEYLLAGIQRLIILDPKAELGHWPNVEDWDDDLAGEFLAGEPLRLRIPGQPGVDMSEAWEDACRFAMEARDCTLYVDEAYQVFGSHYSPSSWFGSVWTMGRSYNVGGWVSVQRPAWIPKVLITEAQHRFCFKLDDEDDRKAMARNGMGRLVLAEIPVEDEHGFYYKGRGMHEAIYYPRLELGHIPREVTA